MLEGVFRYPALDRVAYGRDFAPAVAAEIDRLGAGRVFALIGGTLSRETDLPDRLRAALGPRFAGSWSRMAAHTPRQDVVAAAEAAREARADLLVTLGGGSVTDGGKMLRLCLANDVRTTQALDRFRTRIAADGAAERPEMAEPAMPMVAVPTTLSAGEYTVTAGCTDSERGVKQSFTHPRLGATSVILDPAVSVYTPEWLWLSTGMRAVDHAVADLCSIRATPFSEATAFHALRRLAAGLRGSKADPADRDRRLDCQVGAWLSMVGGQAGVPKGASHGIGHVLGGSCGVPHGYTSCVMLPAVLRFNAVVNAERQRAVSEALGDPATPAAELVAKLIADLGLPARLRDVGVKRDQLDMVAEHAMHDRWIHTNPRKIDGPAAVKEILETAW